MKKIFVLCSILLLSVSLSAQQQKITGTVIDAQGDPIPGANIIIKGTSTGVVSDVNGKYSVNVPDNKAVLVFSFIGFATKEYSVEGQKEIDVVLEEDTKEIEEVVVVGYGTARRGDLTGAISSVSSKDLTMMPTSSTAEALTGKMAGVQVSTAEGSLDASVTIRVRGGGSITQSNEPLFIVDGFPVSSISDIPANDIAGIDVLKDASSAAIYGSRGANGVIIITTKSAPKGRVKVTYNGYVGKRKIAKQLDVLSPYDYALFWYEHQLLTGSDNYTKYFGNWEDIGQYKDMEANDWQDIMFGNIGTSINHNLSVSGGSDKTRFTAGYTHFDENAIMKGSNLSRDNLNLKITNDPHKRVRLELNMRWSNSKMNGSTTNEGGSERGSTSVEPRLRMVMIYPTIPLTNDLDDPDNPDNTFALTHPKIAMRNAERTDERKTLNLNGSVRWEFMDGFFFRSDIGLQQSTRLLERYYGSTTSYVRNNVPVEHIGKPAVEFNEPTSKLIRNSNTLDMNFKKWMPKNHNMNLMLGQEYLLAVSKTFQTFVIGFDESFDLDLCSRLSNQGTAFQTTNNLNPDDKLLSFFGRLNYDYDRKYLLTVNFRADGSSKFAKGNRWGYFPSVSGAWRISSESFMQGAKGWLNDLKLRASYGEVGNDGIPGGQMAQVYTSSITTFVQDFTNYWAPDTRMANPDLVWETTVTRNIGLDWTLFGSKLSGAIDLYMNNTKDLLLNFPVTGTGYATQYRNMGETENRGLEISVNWTALDTKNFGINVGANIAFNRNKVVSLGMMDVLNAGTNWASTNIGRDYIVEVGQPIGQMVGYRVDGRYEVDDFDFNPTNGRYSLKPGIVDCSPVTGVMRPGTIKLQDKLGEGTVDISPEHLQVIGNANPIHTGGFNLNFRVYGFDLSAYFNWTYGNDIYNANKLEWTATSRYHSRNMLAIMADGKRWTNLDKTTGQLYATPEALAAANANTTMWSPYMTKFMFNDWGVEDGSFLRLNTLTLGYTVPSRLTEKVLISNLRIYASGYNVFCWNNYSGFDPEANTRRGLGYTPGVDFAAYPRSRQIVFGLNVTF